MDFYLDIKADPINKPKEYFLSTTALGRLAVDPVGELSVRHKDLQLLLLNSGSKKNITLFQKSLDGHGTKSLLLKPKLTVAVRDTDILSAAEREELWEYKNPDEPLIIHVRIRSDGQQAFVRRIP